MSKKVRCKYCDEPIFDRALASGLCKEHYKLHWKNKWNPELGWVGIKNCLFDCWPNIFVPEYGVPNHMKEVLMCMHEGATNNKTIYENLYSFFLWRGAGKSSTVVGSVAWIAGEKLFEFMLYRGCSSGKAESDFMRRLKKMITKSPLYTLVYGELLSSLRGGETVNQGKEFILTNGFKGKVLGVEQSSQGSLAEEGRIGLIVWDDLETIENVKTEESRDQLYEKVFSEDIPAADFKKSMGVYLGTPKHRDGMAKRIRAHKGFKKIEHWLYKQNSDGSYAYDDNGLKIPNWPEFFGYEKCIAIEDMYKSDPKLGVPLFNREFLGKLESDEDRAIPFELLRFCEIDLKYEYGRNWCLIRSVDGIPEHQQFWQSCNVTLSIDPATSTEGRACNTGGIVTVTLSNGWRIIKHLFYGKYQDRDILKNPNLKYYEIEYKNLDNIEKRGIIGEAFRQIIKWKPDIVVVEGVGEYDSKRKNIEIIRDMWYYKSKQFNNHRFHLQKYLPVKTDKEKKDRIISHVRPHAEIGMLFLDGEIREHRNPSGKLIGKTYPKQELIDELTNLDSISHVDLADSLHFNLIYAQVPSIQSYEKAQYKVKYNDYKPQSKTPVGMAAGICI